MIYQIECSEPWFSHIKFGEKPVEGKKATPRKWDMIREGDTIEFIEPISKEKFHRKVLCVNWYPTLLEYLNGETLQRALPNIQTIQEGLDIYHQWSTDEEIEKYGFLGINLL